MAVGTKRCLVFEDGPRWVVAAQNAGMTCVVIATKHTA
jgi:beta-phosphoglucomutase-like phosphatase (HAD superfamily)